MAEVTVGSRARWLGLALPRSRPAVRRVELDLPGQLEYELVGYPIDEDSAVLQPGALPPWARLALVVRGDAILMPAEARPLKPGDHAYFLAPCRAGSGNASPSPAPSISAPRC